MLDDSFHGDQIFNRINKNVVREQKQRVVPTLFLSLTIFFQEDPFVEKTHKGKKELETHLRLFRIRSYLYTFPSSLFSQKERERMKIDYL